MRSYSAAEAADVLGISVPTLKRMVRAGELDAFKTVGGHLRVRPDSLEAVHQNKSISGGRQVSPVLQNRQDHVQELVLEGQELRATRQLRKEREEEAAEAEQKREERQEHARQAQHQAERLQLERQQLEMQECENAQRAQAQAALRHFRQRWLAHADKLLNGFLGAFWKYDWLTPQQRKEVAEALEAEIAKRTPDHEGRMEQILNQALASFVAPLEAFREIARRREQAIDRTCWKLGRSATDSERVRAQALAREALKQMPLDARHDELLIKAEEVIAPIARAIEEREAREEREKSKHDVIRLASFDVENYKAELRNQGAISSEECFDTKLWDQIKETVRHELSHELTGEESSEEVKGLIRGIVDDELDLESVEEDQD
jgi:excisionase family DNA binding protein